MSHAGWRVAHAEWRAGAPRREPPVTCNAAMTCNGFLFAGNAAVTCNAGGALTFQTRHSFSRGGAREGVRCEGKD
jgi:hypothetical protein